MPHSRSLATVAAALLLAALVACGPAPAPIADTGAFVDGGGSIDTGPGTPTDTGSADPDATSSIDASMTVDAAAPAGAWVCRRTASIMCDCQRGGDPSTFPYPDCSNMPDGRRFCAAATHTLSGMDIQICNCWNGMAMIEDLKMTWMDSPMEYSDIRDVPGCPPG